MSVTGIGAASPASQLQPVNQPKVDRPNDADGDAGDAAKVQSAPAPGTGTNVNKSA